MSATPNKYQANSRTVDNPQRLRALYCTRGLTIEQIAEQYCTVSSSRVGQKLKEYGITDTSSTDSTRSGNRGSDPPESKIQQGRSSDTSDSDPPTVDWSEV